MKKLLIASGIVLFVAAFVFSAIQASNMGDVLLFLNWGEYIDEEMIDAFEDEYGVTVKMSLGDSNEIFYSKVSSGTTVYDVVCPSDYMVEKMYSNDYLEPINFKKIDTFAKRYAKSLGIDVENEEAYNAFLDSKSNRDIVDYVKANELRPGVKSIYNDMNTNLMKNINDYTNSDIDYYFVPYLWGTWGNMYTTGVKGLEEAVTQNENEWACLFDRNSLPSGTKVAMYDSHQHAYYAACRYLGYETDVELGTSKLNKIKSTIKNMNYNAWGTDNIKKDIVIENLDLGFMWTGDFLYYYAEQASKLGVKAFKDGAIDIDGVTTFLRDVTNYPFEEGSTYESNSDGNYDKVYNYTNAKGNTKSYEIGFDFYIPKDTIAFCDNLVVTKDSRHKDLAYDFINFMMNYGTALDEDGNLDVCSSTTYANTYYVCYDAPYNDVYDALLEMQSDEIADWEDKEDIASAAKACKNEDELYDCDLYWYMYDYVTGIGFEKYYEKDTMKGNILAMFDRKYISTINTTFNNARI
ncbi:MAG: hypothetical protein K6E20_02790 [Acholeplasmatales bacterium]|nr:hypothetical protein [Acholeplasmatales bacterium]